MAQRIALVTGGAVDWEKCRAEAGREGNRYYSHRHSNPQAAQEVVDEIEQKG